MNRTIQKIKNNLTICEKNIKEKNEGFLDLLYIIYNNMVKLDGTNPEVNQAIIDCLTNILSDQSIKRKNAIIDYEKEFNKWSNILYTKVDEVN